MHGFLQIGASLATPVIDYPIVDETPAPFCTAAAPPRTGSAVPGGPSIGAVTDQRPPTSLRGGLHLLWTIPLALVVTAVAAFWMTLTWCGVSGCSGGGFGRISDPSLPSVLGAAVVVVLVWWAAVAVPRWHRVRLLRIAVGLGVGLLIALVVAALATDFLVTTRAV